MKETIANDQFAVWDNVLSPHDFGTVMAHVSNQKYYPTHKNNWESVWKITDGEGMRSEPLYTERFLTGTPMDLVFDAMIAATMNRKELCGSNWNRMCLTSYIYPTGSRLSWHGDGDAYTAALTYYCHPRWSPHWGGELLVASTPHSNLMPKLDYNVSPAVDHNQYDAWINAYGVGNMIIPKPNRLVLMKAGVCHMVNRVDPAAGDNLRMSVVGFTLSLPPALSKAA